MRICCLGSGGTGQLRDSAREAWAPEVKRRGCDCGNIVGVDYGDRNTGERAANYVAGTKLRQPAERIRHKAAGPKEGPGEAGGADCLLGFEPHIDYRVLRIPVAHGPGEEQNDMLDCGLPKLCQQVWHIGVTSKQKDGTYAFESGRAGFGMVVVTVPTLAGNSVSRG